MHPFFDPVIRPLLDAAGARTVVEVGAERGHTTTRLLSWAAGNGATIHSIDPEPRFDVARTELEHGERLRFHRARSLDVLGTITGVDAALIDGDHNWYSVISELRLLAAAATRADAPLPLVVAHDAGWPYGRRDIYYDPESILADHRHDVARATIAPGRSQHG
jgi:predicted O-methyltransferase YrrM